METHDGLAAQIEEARLGHRARHILIAVIEGEEYDVGETVLGPASEVGERLRRLGLSEDRIARAAIRAVEAPLLY